MKKDVLFMHPPRYWPLSIPRSQYYTILVSLLPIFPTQFKPSIVESLSSIIHISDYFLVGNLQQILRSGNSLKLTYILHVARVYSHSMWAGVRSILPYRNRTDCVDAIVASAPPATSTSDNKPFTIACKLSTCNKCIRWDVN